jgi:hypothetical protein
VNSKLLTRDINKMHREVESFPRVNTFLDSIKRNSNSTALLSF